MFHAGARTGTTVASATALALLWGSILTGAGIRATPDPSTTKNSKNEPRGHRVGRDG